MGHFLSPNLVKPGHRGPVDLMDRGSPDLVTLDRQIWAPLKSWFLTEFHAENPHILGQKGVILDTPKRVVFDPKLIATGLEHGNRGPVA